MSKPIPAVDHFMRMVDMAPESMVLCDARAPDRPLVYVNRAFEDLTGYRFEEVEGRNCRFLRSGQESPEVLERLRACQEDRIQDTITMRNRRRDDSLFWNRLTITPLFDPDGELTHFLGVQRDVSDYMQLLQQLEHQDHELDLASRELVKLATRDALTTVYNRRYFLKRLEREFSHCRQHGSSIAVFNVDVDHFKYFNEYFGHQQGDECLQRIAHVLRISFTRPGDVVARYSDVEFIISATGMHEESARLQAETVRQRVRELNLHDAEGRGIRVSIGIAIGSPGKFLTTDRLITCAAHELARAKREGRDRTCCTRL